MHQRDPVHPLGQSGRSRIQRGLIPVDADEPSGGEPPGDLPGVTGPAQRAVDIDPVGLDVQARDTFVQQNRTMGKFCHNHNPSISNISATFAGSS